MADIRSDRVLDSVFPEILQQSMAKVFLADPSVTIRRIGYRATIYIGHHASMSTTPAAKAKAAQAVIMCLSSARHHRAMSSGYVTTALPFSRCRVS
jgi:hypothetical protein